MSIDSSTLPTLPEMIETWQQTLKWLPDANQQQQFQRLYELIVDGNQQLNLTRITEPSEFWEKHLWDSLRGIYPSTFSLFTPPAASDLAAELADPIFDPSNLAPERSNPIFDPSDLAPEYANSIVDSAEMISDVQALSSAPPPRNSKPSVLKIIDIGTGGGFPGVPVAIALPHAKLTLVDSTQKKITFLSTVLEQLGLDNARAIASRAEAVGKSPQYRKSFDIALIRAVASANVCAEYVLPLLKIGGVAVLYRGQWTDAEQQTLEVATHQLGGTVEHVEAFTTPLSQGIRHCLYLRKVKLTPSKFPRSAGVPARQPLPLS